jgi:hypothetical protein
VGLDSAQDPALHPKQTASAKRAVILFFISSISFLRCESIRDVHTINQ